MWRAWSALSFQEGKSTVISLARYQVIWRQASFQRLSMPDNVFGGDDENNVATCLTWEQQMEFEDDPADVNKVDRSGKRPKGEKLCLTKVEESTEDFLQEAFTPMSNENQNDLWGKFTVVDTPFTTQPRLDKLMATECSKNVKSAHQSHSCIQALFLDPLTCFSETRLVRTSMCIEKILI